VPPVIDRSARCVLPRKITRWHLALKCSGVIYFHHVVHHCSQFSSPSTLTFIQISPNSNTTPLNSTSYSTMPWWNAPRTAWGRIRAQTQGHGRVVDMYNHPPPIDRLCAYCQREPVCDVNRDYCYWCYSRMIARNPPINRIIRQGDRGSHPWDWR
jgi:hypothetical protein